MKTILIGLLAIAPAAAIAAGNAEKGRSAYLQNGCWQCHGYAAQGGITGPKLAPNPMPFEAMNVFVRHSNRAMPPYQKAVLSDADLADIHAWLQTIPAGKDYKAIPLLNNP